MNRNDIQKAIESGKTALGIEFGSTRIKDVLIGEDHTPSPPAAMIGKIGMKMASGHTVSETSLVSAR